jgi:hypothetical protein
VFLYGGSATIEHKATTFNGSKVSFSIAEPESAATTLNSRVSFARGQMMAVDQKRF